MRRLVLITALTMLSGCVMFDTYDKKVLEATNLKTSLDQEQAKSAALDAKKKELETKLADLEAARAKLEERATKAEERGTSLEADLTSKEADRGQLEQKLAEVTALNEELAKSTKKLAEAKAELEKKSSDYEGLAKSLTAEISAGKIELSELKGKMTVKMKDKILFASGSATIGQEGLDALGKVAKAFKGLRGRIVRVDGHTDNEPLGKTQGFANNWELSVARALAVVKVLQDAGVDPTVLSAAGFGEYHPIARNDTAEHKSLNRRIEIVIAPPESNLPAANLPTPPPDKADNKAKEPAKAKPPAAAPPKKK